MIRSISVLLCILTATANACATELSYILDCPGGGARVYRGSQTIAVASYFPLLSGDKVVTAHATATDVSGKARIVLFDGNKEVVLDANSTPYCIGSPEGDCARAPAADGQPSPYLVAMSNVFASITGIFKSAQGEHDADAADSMVSRGGDTADAPIVVALLALPGQRIVSGTRPLSLEWKGGKAPFRVALYGANAATALETVNASGRTAAFPALPIPAGTYRFQIDDADGKTGGGVFEAVTPDAGPAMTPDESRFAADTSLPADLRETVGAASLLQRAPAFAFEAYQRVAPLASDYAPAELLRYHLTEPG